MGFAKDQLISMHVFGADSIRREEFPLIDRVEEVKEAFSAHPNVLAATASGSVPPWMGVERKFSTGAGAETRQWYFYELNVDHDFTDAFGIELVEGLALPERTSDLEEIPVLLNETAIRNLGWSQPRGRRLRLDAVGLNVVGVVRDFHIRSLHEPIPPMVLRAVPEGWADLTVRVGDQDYRETIEFLKEVWLRFLPNERFAHWSPSWSHDSLLYRNERRLIQALGLFAGVSVVLACGGVLGLAAIATSDRNREIAIRRVLGGGTLGISGSLLKQFSVPYATGVALSVPFSYITIERWLGAFAYRVDVVLPVVLCAAVGGSILVLSAGLSRVFLVSRKNPIEALR